MVFERRTLLCQDPNWAIQQRRGTGGDCSCSGGVSAQTAPDLCAERGLSEPSFYAWKRGIAQRDQERRTHTQTPARASAHAATGALPAFVPVRLDATVSTACALEVVVGGGRVLGTLIFALSAGYNSAQRTMFSDLLVLTSS
jgi:hypothetical protein